MKHLDKLFFAVAVLITLWVVFMIGGELWSLGK